MTFRSIVFCSPCFWSLSVVLLFLSFTGWDRKFADAEERSEVV